MLKDIVSEQRGMVKSFILDMVEAKTTMKCGSVNEHVLKVLQLVCQQPCLDLTGDVGGVHNP